LRRQQWRAIAAGLFLLVAPGYLLAPSVEAGIACDGCTRGDPAAPQAAAHAGIVLALERANPALGRELSARIADSVLRCSNENGLPADLVLAVMLVESSGRPSARSPKGAIGLMQVMPHMFEELELPGSVAHVETNVQAGCLLLADNVRRLGEADGISSYFWGSSIRGDAYLKRVRTVRRALAMPAGARPGRG
jgi:soluble lytic murein transglycosylase-like protein